MAPLRIALYIAVASAAFPRHSPKIKYNHVGVFIRSILCSLTLTLHTFKTIAVSNNNLWLLNFFFLLYIHICTYLYFILITTRRCNLN
jgi:hypothetical protein